MRFNIVLFSSYYRSDIERHAKGDKHKANVIPLAQKTLFSFCSDSNRKKEESIKYAEIKLAGWTAAHDQPFLVMDHLIPLLQDIFPDSDIAQSLAMKKTKNKGVIMNVLGADEKENMTCILKSSKFSILTDESTDIASVKTACILVRLYSEINGRIVTRFWNLEQIFHANDPRSTEEGASAKRLFEMLQETFRSRDIPYDNVIGFASDGCNVMMGCKNSVASRMKECYPGIRIVKCLSHSLHLCASEACKVLPRACEDLARNIFNFLNGSAKRQASFAQFQMFLSIDVLKILHPSQTRWLSLVAVVVRILDNWDALRLFFDEKWLSERLETVERIHIALNDSITKSYFLFLAWVLPKISGMNEYFQSEKIVATFVHEKMVNSYKDLLLTFMKREYVYRTDVQEIRPDDLSHWLDISQLYLGVGVLRHLEKKEESEKAQPIHEFKIRCRNFLVTVCVQMKQRYGHGHFSHL